MEDLIKSMSCGGQASSFCHTVKRGDLKDSGGDVGTLRMAAAEAQVSKKADIES